LGMLIEEIGYEDISIESLWRELLRNGQLRNMCGFLALCVMLAIAVGRIKKNQQDKMRSLVK
jgi:hypothetical protein